MADGNKRTRSSGQQPAAREPIVALPAPQWLHVGLKKIIINSNFNLFL